MSSDSWTPHPEAQRKEAETVTRDSVGKDYDRAMQCLEQAVKLHTADVMKKNAAGDVTNTAEIFWLWLNSESIDNNITWPTPEEIEALQQS